MSESSQLGRLIVRYRVAAGLLQVDLAKLSKISAGTLSAIESGGTSRPNPKTLRRLADALKLTEEQFAELLDLAGTKAEAGHHGRSDLPAVTLAETLKAHRRRAGMTVRELAAAAPVSDRTIKLVESGRSPRIRASTASMIATALHLSEDESRHFLLLAVGDTDPAEEWRRRVPATLRGRDDEYLSLLGLLRGRRLVSVTGPGGVGKSTLAEAAIGALDGPVVRFALADLPLGTDATVALALAANLDDVDADARLQQIAESVPDDAVILLDNVEHLTAVAAAIDGLLALRREMRILVTSRTVTGASGEQVFPLRPLASADAIAVFRDAAVAAGRPIPQDSDPAVLARICDRADRLPLAIRLAAAWSRLLSVDEILASLDRGARALRSPGTGVTPGRHSAMGQVVAGSLRLLSEQAQALFRTMAALPGAWPLDLLEAVHPGGDDLLDPLHELVDTQLVDVTVTDGVSWFGMLQTVRDVGLDAVSADRARHGLIRDRHAGAVVAWAEQAAAGYVTKDVASWLDRTDRLYRHCESANEHLVALRHPDAVRLTAALWRYWQLRGRFRAGLTALHAALDMAPPNEEPPERVRARANARYGAGVLGHWLGSNDQATADAMAAMAAYEMLGDPDRIGAVMSLLGMITLHTGDPEGAFRWYDKGLRLVTWEREPRAYVTLLANIAPVHAALGDLEAAISAAEDALTRYQILPDWHGVAAQLGNLANWSAQLGDMNRARVQLAEASQLFDRLNDPAARAEVHVTLAEFAINEGDVPAAEAEIERALTLTADLEEPWMAAYGAALRAEARLLSGNAPAARREARAAWVLADPLGYRPALIRAALVEAVAEIRLGSRFNALKPAYAGLKLCGDTDIRQIVSLALTVMVVRAGRPAGAELNEAISRLGQAPGCEPYAVVFLIGSTGPARPGDGSPSRSREAAVELRSLAMAACE